MNISPDNLIRVLEWLISMAGVFKKLKDFFTNPIIKYGLIILIISYVAYWLGFT